MFKDLLEDSGPRRTTAEEDEEHAASLVPQYTVLPDIELEAGCAGAETVLFLLGQTSSLLVSALLGSSPPPPAGRISVPELQRLKSPLEEELGLAHRAVVHAAAVRRLGPAGTGGLAVVDAPRVLPAEQAVTWARTVLTALRPSSLVVVDTLPAMRYCGPGSPADEDLVFGIRSSAAGGGDGDAGGDSGGGGGGGGGGALPDLPPGTILDGLPAALLMQAEGAGLPAVAVVGVQMGPSPDAQFVASLALGAAAALGSLGGGATGLVQQRSRTQLVAEVQAAADSMHRGSAGSSIFV